MTEDKAPSTRHVEYLLRRHGAMTDPERIEAALDAYRKRFHENAPIVIEPGEASNIQAALVFPDPDLWDATCHTRKQALVLRKPNNLGVSLLRYGTLSSKEGLETRDRIIAALENAFTTTNGLVTDKRSGDFREQTARQMALSAFHDNARRVFRTSSEHIRQEICDRADAFATETSTHDPLWPNRSFETAFGAIQDRIERARLQRGLDAFCRHLDPTALRIARATAEPTDLLYNLLQGDGDPQNARYRQQAFDAYPLFARYLRNNEVLDRIDNGEPPPRVLASFAASPDATSDIDHVAEVVRPDTVAQYERGIRQLHGVTWQKAGRAAYRNPDVLINHMVKIPANWQPTGRREYASFLSVMDSATTVADYLDRSSHDLLKGIRQPWPDLASKLPDEPGLGVRDMLDRALNTLVLPAWVRLCRERGDGQIRENTIPHSLTSVRRLTGKALFGQKNLLKILEANARFHRNLPRIRAVASKSDENIAWPALSAPTNVQAGMRVIPLTTQADLSDEGNAMDHCVGGYAEACLDDSHIVSVRDPDDRRVATAQLREITNDDGYTELKITEIEGPSNTEPSKDARKAVNRYVTWLNEPANAPDYGAIEREREEVNAARDQSRLINKIGFDPEDLTNQEAVWQEWRHLIIGPAGRAHTYSEFMHRSGLTALLNECMDEALHENALSRQVHENRELSKRLRDTLEQNPTPIDPASVPKGNVLRFDEHAGLPRGSSLNSKTFVQPGNTALLHHVSVDWSDVAGTDAEAERRAQILRQAMWEKAYKLSSLPYGLQVAADADTIVVGHTHAEARVYKETAQELFLHLEPHNAPPSLTTPDPNEHVSGPEMSAS